MRAVIQRVGQASVTVEGKLVSAIGPGLCVLVGLHQQDDESDVEYIVRKILNTRVFPDATATRHWDKSVKDLGFEVLCVSQFTLYGTLKGNKPDFRLAMKTDQARDMYESFLRRMRRDYAAAKVKDGVFGAKMLVAIENDGPVTLIFDSRNRGDDATPSSSSTSLHTLSDSRAGPAAE